MLGIDSGLQHTAGKIRHVMNDGTALLHPRVGAMQQVRTLEPTRPRVYLPAGTTAACM
jgi:hypothetical protein